MYHKKILSRHPIFRICVFFSSNPHAKTELVSHHSRSICSHNRSRCVSNQSNNIRILQAQEHWYLEWALSIKGLGNSFFFSINFSSNEPVLLSPDNGQQWKTNNHCTVLHWVPNSLPFSSILCIFVHSLYCFYLSLPSMWIYMH